MTERKADVDFVDMATFSYAIELLCDMINCWKGETKVSGKI